MTWLASIIRAILDWLTAEVKKDTKASDADDIPKDIKDKWRKRIEETEKTSIFEFKQKHSGEGEKSTRRLREEKKARDAGYKANEKGEWVKHENN